MKGTKEIFLGRTKRTYQKQKVFQYKKAFFFLNILALSKLYIPVREKRILEKVYPREFFLKSLFAKLNSHENVST